MCACSGPRRSACESRRRCRCWRIVAGSGRWLPGRSRRLSGCPRWCYAATSASPSGCCVTGLRIGRRGCRAWRRSLSPGEPAGVVAVRLEATMAVHQAALDRLGLAQRRLEQEQTEARQAARQRSRWDDRHRLPLAIGLYSAYELAQRDLEALIALERDPPAYLKRELGGVPDGIPGQVAWRDGARLIERYRAEYNVDYPTAALGPAPSGQAAGLARQQVAQAVQALKVELHRGAVVRNPPGELPEIDLGPALP